MHVAKVEKRRKKQNKERICDHHNNFGSVHHNANLYRRTWIDQIDRQSGALKKNK